MSLAAPIFDPQSFERRGFTNPYFTEGQQSRVNLVESRVNGQLDWLAQLLGWNGPNYWGFPDSTLNGVPYAGLPGSVNQKRQLLSGSFGFYNGFIYPELISVENWSDLVIVKKDPRIKENQKIYLGDQVYSILSVAARGDTYELSLGTLPSQFYEALASNEQLKIHDISLCPEPFYRPIAGVSADFSFVCGRVDSSLSLYPSYDLNKLNPYITVALYPGSVYYFDQNVYITYDGSGKDITCTYDSQKQKWFLQIPGLGSEDQLPPAATLVWPLYDPSTDLTSLATLSIIIKSWEDPSDWDNLDLVYNFKGVWGDKGGVLPFNFVFDALSLHGFDERTSVLIRETSAEITYNQLLNSVYYQQITVSETEPYAPENGDVWWNSSTGVFSVWIDYAGVCSSWIEVDYRIPPEDYIPTDFTYANTTEFITAAYSIPVNSFIDISNCQGLSNFSSQILLTGLEGVIQGNPTVYLYKVEQKGLTSIWKLVKFVYSDSLNFNLDALILPYKTPVELLNANGLEPDSKENNYQISNLSFIPGGLKESNVGVFLIKLYTNRMWEVSPDSILKYIANTTLYSSEGAPLEGEAWWDYEQPVPPERSAALYYFDQDGEQWVEFSKGSLYQDRPPSVFDLNFIVVYCDGTLVEEGITLMQNNYSFSYQSGPVYRFNFRWSSEGNVLRLPKITVSDSLTGLFRADITPYIFTNGTWKATPNTLNSEVPLRVWKTQSLQVCDTLDLLDRDTYYNPLVADLNLGVADKNWSNFFIRLPLEYERNGHEWQQINLICQDFTYYGTPSYPESMVCPSEDDRPAIYEELAVNSGYTTALNYVYSEPYWYSNAFIFANFEGVEDYENAFIGPTLDNPQDNYDEALLISYDPYHNRLADTTSPIGKGYGNWLGEYVSVPNCGYLSGFFTDDLVSGVLNPVAAPTWDASIYKYAPTCLNSPETYEVDANNYKIGYAYFVADLSAANEGFFDLETEVSWRYPETLPKTGYITPSTMAG